MIHKFSYGDTNILEKKLHQFNGIDHLEEHHVLLNLQRISV